MNYFLSVTVCGKIVVTIADVVFHAANVENSTKEQ